MFQLKSKFAQWVTLLFLAFLWGSSFFLMKRGLETYTNMQVAAFRMLVASLAVVPWVWKYRHHFVGKHFKWILVVALFGNGIPAFLFTKAQTVLDSSITGMLNSLVPLFTLMIGLLAFRMRTELSKVIGIVIGLAGALLMIWADGIESPGDDWMYTGFVIIASLCYALSVNAMKYRLQGVDSMAITALALMMVGPLCGIWLFTTDFTERVVSDGPTKWPQWE